MESVDKADWDAEAASSTNLGSASALTTDSAPGNDLNRPVTPVEDDRGKVDVWHTPNSKMPNTSDQVRASGMKDSHTPAGKFKNKGRPTSMVIKERERSNSMGSITEFMNRKRIADDSGKELNPFKKSSLTARSPKKDENKQTLETISRECKSEIQNREDKNPSADNGNRSRESTMLEKMMEEITAMRKESREERAKLYRLMEKDREEVMNELRLIREDFHTRGAEWVATNQNIEMRLSVLEKDPGHSKAVDDLMKKENAMEQRLQVMENKLATIECPKIPANILDELSVARKNLEAQERWVRKNNLIINGLDIDEDKAMETVNEFLSKEFGVSNKVLQVKKIGPSDKAMFLTVMDSWESKLHILRQKSKLRGTQIFLEHDLTPKERIAAKKCRDFAREQRSRGKHVRTGYNGVQVDGQWFGWDENNGVLVEKPNGQRSASRKRNASGTEEQPKNE